MGPEEIPCATQLELSEMALAGPTCASDHLYLFPNGARLDDEIEAAEEIGLRLHATRRYFKCSRFATSGQQCFPQKIRTIGE